MATLADRQLHRDMANLLTDLAERIRSGQVPRWAIETVVPSIQMVAHVIQGVRKPEASSVQPCPACDGFGYLPPMIEPGPTRQDCPRCQGARMVQA